jgi:hypothetical protein
MPHAVRAYASAQSPLRNSLAQWTFGGLICLFLAGALLRSLDLYQSPSERAIHLVCLFVHHLHARARLPGCLSVGQSASS